MTHRVRAYGLDIWSDIALPEFMPPGDGVDVVVVLEAPDAAVDVPSPKWDFAQTEAVANFPNVGKFYVRGGHEIRITPVPGADTELIRLYVEGMMMAVILHQRGNFVLHASVVDLWGRAAAFIGHIGAGKSTMALALERLGHRLVADDNAAVSIATGDPQVIPAFPRIKVYPEIARVLGVADDDLMALHASQVKKTRQIDSFFPTRPSPLDRIYVLSREAEPGIRRLHHAPAFIEVIKNSVPTRWGLPGGRAQMDAAAELMRTVPVYSVRTFDQLGQIRSLARQIEAHARPAAHMAVSFGG